MIAIGLELATLTPERGCELVPGIFDMPELVNTIANAVALILTTYVISITHRLDKEVRNGGE